jgi:hypothetical protein
LWYNGDVPINITCKHLTIFTIRDAITNILWSSDTNTNTEHDTDTDTSTSVIIWLEFGHAWLGCYKDRNKRQLGWVGDSTKFNQEVVANKGGQVEKWVWVSFNDY